jgi:transposase
MLPGGLRTKLQLISQKTKLAAAIRYTLSRWQGLCLFLEDGRVEIDNNVVERSIRPLALTRKNALFAGSDGGAEHWAVIASLIETCKLIGVEPYAYLAETATPTAASTSSCLGLIPPRPISRPWPENTAYTLGGRHGRICI